MKYVRNDNGSRRITAQHAHATYVNMQIEEREKAERAATRGSRAAATRKANQEFIKILQAPTTIAEMDALIAKMSEASATVAQAIADLFLSMRNAESFIVIEDEQYLVSDTGSVAYSMKVQPVVEEPAHVAQAASSLPKSQRCGQRKESNMYQAIITRDNILVATIPADTALGAECQALDYIEDAEEAEDYMDESYSYEVEEVAVVVEAEVGPEPAPQELTSWLDEIREKGIAPSDAPKVYIITAHLKDGGSKEFRCLDASQAEQDAWALWQQGRWSRIDINGVQRYPVENEPQEALQCAWDSLQNVPSYLE